MARDRITVFDVATGQVVGWRRVDMGREPIVLPEGRDWIAGHVDDATHYVDPVTHEPVPLMTFDVTVSHGVVSGIPAGSSAMVNLERFAVDDGSLELEADYPQVLRVTLQHPLYLIAEVEVACGPQED